MELLPICPDQSIKGIAGTQADAYSEKPLPGKITIQIVVVTDFHVVNCKGIPVGRWYFGRKMMSRFKFALKNMFWSSCLIRGRVSLGQLQF